MVSFVKGVIGTDSKGGFDAIQRHGIDHHQKC